MVADISVVKLISALEKTEVFQFVRKKISEQRKDEMHNAPGKPKYQGGGRRPNIAAMSNRLSALEAASNSDPSGAISEAAVKRALKTGESFEQALEHVRGRKYQIAKQRQSTAQDRPQRDRYVPFKAMGEPVRYLAGENVHVSGDEKESGRAVARALRERITFGEAMTLNAQGGVK